MNWDAVKHFKAGEFARPDRMDAAFIRQIDAFRQKINERVVVSFSNGADEKHQAGSLHYCGKACDIVFDRPVSLDDVFEASRFFTEVGIYPKWKNAAAPNALGGLHVGFESLLYRFPMHRKYWVGVGGKYLPMTLENLRTARFA